MRYIRAKRLVVSPPGSDAGDDSAFEQRRQSSISVGRRARDRARLNRVFLIVRRSQTITDISAVGLAVAAAAAWSGSACAAAHSAGDVTEARVTAETPGDNWLVKGGSFAQQQFSPLKEINDKNVAHLGLAWITEMDDPMGLAAEPIVVDGVIYLSAPRSIVRAIDAANGKILWTSDPHVRLDFSMGNHR